MPTRIILLMGCLYNPETKECLGVKGVGKDTAADMIIGVRPESRKFALANGLKQLVQHRLGLRQDQYDFPDKKEEPLPDYLGFPSGTTYRKVLELVGTEVVRHGMGMPDAWIDALDRQIFDLVHDIMDEPDLDKGLRSLGYPVKPAPTIYKIITDVRYPNEYTHYKMLGLGKPVAVLVRRPCISNPSAGSVPGHASNLRYEEMKPDYVIENNGTEDELRLKVNFLLEQLEHE